jgi:hypothetical protein
VRPTVNDKRIACGGVVPLFECEHHISYIEIRTMTRFTKALHRAFGHTKLNELAPEGAEVEIRRSATGSH